MLSALCRKRIEVGKWLVKLLLIAVTLSNLLGADSSLQDFTIIIVQNWAMASQLISPAKVFVACCWWKQNLNRVIAICTRGSDDPCQKTTPVSQPTIKFFSYHWKYNIILFLLTHKLNSISSRNNYNFLRITVSVPWIWFFTLGLFQRYYFTDFEIS